MDKATYLDEDAVIALFETCSNVDRWGEQDELGTLNYITPSKRAQAAGLVSGVSVVSLSRDLSTKQSPANPTPVVHKMLYVAHSDPITCLDSIEVTPHGFDVTHQDAVGHVYFEGTAWNGRRAEAIVGPDGMEFGSIYALRDGIVTRGILLDVAASRGVAYLEPGEPVWPSDLEAAEARGGTEIESGDAVFVRVGLGAREAANLVDPGEPRAGLTAGCLEWLHSKQISVYSGDCVEQIPSPYKRVTLPLHMIGMVAMGLALLDNVQIESLAQRCSEVGRNAFMLVVAPLRIPKATGSPVNPLALF